MVSGRSLSKGSSRPQGRDSLRHLQSAHTRVLGSYGRVHASFNSTCALCFSLIAKGSPIRFDVAASKFVHESCARVRATAARPTLQLADPRSARLPAGVKPATLRGYTTEWARYEGLARRLGHVSIPGRDGPWDLQLLWQYMSFRGRTCKPQTVTASLSALAYFGVQFNNLLPTSKHDSDSLMYRQLSLLK